RACARARSPETTPPSPARRGGPADRGGNGPSPPGSGGAVSCRCLRESPVPLEEELARPVPRKALRVLEPERAQFIPPVRRAAATPWGLWGSHGTAAGPEASSGEACDEAPTGAPQAIASVIGMPKPSNRDG